MKRLLRNLHTPTLAMSAATRVRWAGDLIPSGRNHHTLAGIVCCGDSSVSISTDAVPGSGTGAGTGAGTDCKSVVMLACCSSKTAGAWCIRIPRAIPCVHACDKNWAKW